MQSKKILLLITDLQRGGTPTVVRELAIRLKPFAHVQVACLSTWGPVADDLQNNGIPVTALGARNSLDVRIAFRLADLLRAEGFDTIFSFLIHANALAALMSLWFKDVRFLQSIQTTQPWPRWHWALQRLVWRVAENVVVPSPSTAQAAHQWSSVPNETLVVIPNAVDVDSFATLRAENKAIEKPAQIVFIGRLDRVKDVPTLIEAIAKSDQDWQLHIYGEGGDRSRIEETIARFAAEQRVTLHGEVVSVMPALARADVLVLPSLAEGFGLVLIEAMAAGVPVVATNVAGIRDVVQHEQTGLLVKASDPEALRQGIVRVLREEALRKSLVQNGREFVRRIFSWTRVLEMYRSIL